MVVTAIRRKGAIVSITICNKAQWWSQRYKGRLSFSHNNTTKLNGVHSHTKESYVVIIAICNDKWPSAINEIAAVVTHKQKLISGHSENNETQAPILKPT
jgi:hypothetical protein